MPRGVAKLSIAARWACLFAMLALAGCERAQAREKAPPTRFELNASCIGCHEPQAQQWADSLHRRSWTDASFAHAYRNEPSPFCWGCHAPESATASPPKGPAARAGVACVTCHLAPSAQGVRPTPDHPEMLRSDALRTDACSRCHEFGFESKPSLAMQSTLSEHRGSAFASESCASCHMVDGSHSFATTRDPVLLRAALEASPERDGDTVRVRLRSRGVGHAFPTGDTFRALHVEVGRSGGPAAAEADLQRVFALERARSGLGFVLEEVADTRLAADGSETTLELSVPGAASDPIWWRVVYERRDNPFKANPRTFDRIELAGGTLEPEESQ